MAGDKMELTWEQRCRNACNSAQFGLRRALYSGLWDYTRNAMHTPQEEPVMKLPGEACYVGFDGNWNRRFYD